MKANITAVALAALALGVCVPAPRARAETSAECSATFNDACLLQTLTDMGLEVRPLSHGYLVTVKQDKWTMFVQFRLSDDGSRLGLNANLGDVNEAEVTAAQWQAILAANIDVDPSSFNYSPDRKKLYIHRVLDNRDLTAAILRQQLDNFIANIRSSEAVWSQVAH